jgi:MFS family permease
MLQDELHMKRRPFAWLGEFALMASVALLSLLLLLYVGFGEAKRTYETFFVEKLAAQNNVLAAAIESFLRRDLPLEQYVGFGPRADRLLASDQTITSLFVLDAENNVVFGRGNASTDYDLYRLSEVAPRQMHGDRVTFDDQRLFVATPLANRYHDVGALVIAMATNNIGSAVNYRFMLLLPPTIVLAFVFAGFAVWRRTRRAADGNAIIYGSFALIFMVVAIVIVVTLASLYNKGAQIKTSALADSLAQRMSEVIGFNLDLAQIPGLDRAFADYRRLNPDISAAALLVNGQIVIHTDSYNIGYPWQSDVASYEYLVDIVTRENGDQVTVAVVLPQSVVYSRVLRSVKNFAALFVASAFLASVLFQFSSMVRAKGERENSTPIPSSAGDVRNLVKPLFLFTTGIEHLSYAFLPQYLSGIAITAGYSADVLPFVFGAYYLAFALVLVPAGQLGERLSAKPILIAGLIMCAIGYGLLMGQATIWTAVAARICSGLGQGLIFISVQTILLATSRKNERTRAAGVIVYGFQGGMIAGMAIGSLVVSSIGEFGVLLTSAAAMLLLVAYALFYLPSVTPDLAKRDLNHSIFKSVTAALNDRPFMGTVICIGIPAKAVLTGVIIFAVPLLMTAQGFAEAEIGQMLMLYAGAVMLASQLSGTYIDLHKATRSALLVGATLAGLGMVGLTAIDWVGFVGLPFGETLRVVAIVMAMLTIGIGHGFINAPIVAYVSSLAIAQKVGISGLTASYRFLERIGHVAGPLLVGLFFQLYGESGEALFWLGVGLTSLMLVFALVGHRAPTVQPETFQLIGEPRSLVGLYIDGQAAVMALRIDAFEQSAPLAAAARLLAGHLQRHGYSLTLAENRDSAPLPASSQQLASFAANYLPSEGQSPSHLIVFSGPKGSEVDKLSVLGLLVRSDTVVYLAKRHWLEQLQGWLAMLALNSKGHGAVPKVTLAAALDAASKAEGVFIWHADDGSGQRRTKDHDQSSKEQTYGSLQPA